jgi:glycosyltransferase involved in cell wall biosynthesis
MNLVSVIIPCYNCEKYVLETVQSVLYSDYSPIEIILINDGSTDDTLKIITQLAELNPTISVYNIQNSGPSKARNIAISKAKGDYILPLDGDDKIDSQYIAKALNILVTNPSIKVVYCNAEYFGEKSGSWNLPEFNLKRLALNNMIFISAMFRKIEWENISWFDENMIYGIEDWDFWISILKDGGKVHKIDYTGFYYRITKQSRTNKLFKNGKLDLMHQYLFNKHKEFFLRYLTNPLSLNHQLEITKFQLSNAKHEIESANNELHKIKNKSFVKQYLYFSNLNKKIRKKVNQFKKKNKY